jgi:hypothetical protein
MRSPPYILQRNNELTKIEIIGPVLTKVHSISEMRKGVFYGW